MKRHAPPGFDGSRLAWETIKREVEEEPEEAWKRALLAGSSDDIENIAVPV